MKILYHHRIASKDGQYVHVEELTDALTQLEHKIIRLASDYGTKQIWLRWWACSEP